MYVGVHYAEWSYCMHSTTRLVVKILYYSIMYQNTKFTQEIYCCSRGFAMLFNVGKLIVSKYVAESINN